MVIAKGLPWSYSPQGILMHHGGQAHVRGRGEKNQASSEANTRLTWTAKHTCSSNGRTYNISTYAIDTEDKEISKGDGDR